MKVEVESELKPLYTNLRIMGIGEYLISEQFNHLCLEKDIDNLWKDCVEYVKAEKEVLVAIPGYTEAAEEAFAKFLNQLFKGERNRFIDVLAAILSGFADWNDEKKDFSKIKEILSDLEIPPNKIEGKLPHTQKKLSLEETSPINSELKITEEIFDTYSEDELRTIVKLHLKSLDYKVEDIHEADPSGEKGTDLIYYKDGKEIGMAIKIKPKKEDIYQMQELAERGDIDEKIYIYLETPTMDFREKMEEYKDRVDFWDGKTLAQKMKKENLPLYTEIKLCNHLFFLRLSKIMWKLQQLLYEIRENDEEEVDYEFNFDKDRIKKAWRLKDDLVNFNKSFLHLKVLIEEKPETIDGPVAVNNILFKWIDIVGFDTRANLPEFIDQNKKLSKFIAQKTEMRSNWLTIADFRYRFMSEKNRKELGIKIDRDWPVDDVVLAPKNKEESLRRLRGIYTHLSKSFRAAEGFIDDVYDYSIDEIDKKL